MLGSVFFLFFLGLGGFFLFMLGQEAWRSAEPRTWDTTLCRILSSQVVVEDGSDPYRPEVWYEFSFASDTRKSHQIQRRVLRFDDYDSAERVTSRYPAEAIVHCAVSPTGEAVLEHRPLWFALFALLPAIFVLIGGAGLVSVWRGERRDRFGQPVVEPISSRATAGAGGRVAPLFFGVFALVGLVAGWFLAVKPLAGVLSARSWEAHTCLVERSRVQSHRGDDGTTYSVDILYRYQRGERVYRSSRYQFMGGSSGGRAGKAAIVRAHPVGAEVSCYVDPRDPSQAVIERGLTWEFALAAIPLVFLAFGIGGIVYTLRSQTKRARRQQALTGGASHRPVFESEAQGQTKPLVAADWLPDLDPQDAGQAVLEARSSRFGRLIGIVFACLFWNGIVWLFLSEAASTRGGFGVFMTLFMIPFVLVGLALIGGVGHALLALRNARPRLVASARALRLGETLDLAWELHGRTANVARVRIFLEGREEATYRRGTDTQTRSEVFRTVDVLDTRDRCQMTRGRASLPVPRDTVHSFAADNNKIVWDLRVVGEIARWPDVDERYPLTLLPSASAEGRA